MDATVEEAALRERDFAEFEQRRPGGPRTPRFAGPPTDFRAVLRPLVLVVLVLAIAMDGTDGESHDGKGEEQEERRARGQEDKALDGIPVKLQPRLQCSGSGQPRCTLAVGIQLRGLAYGVGQLWV